MQGSSAVIEVLNELLTAELTVINQYFIHAKMCENWGLERLAEKIRDESIDEMKDADKVIERILYLEGVPNLQRLNSVRVGETVPEQLAAELQTEQEAVARLTTGIQTCRTIDEGTRLLLEEILEDEEDHIDWLETQLGLIEKLGEALYLSTQVHS